MSKLVLLFCIHLALCTLELTYSFEPQSCSRSSYFKLRIDNHFNQPILQASVSSPPFLSISSRSISSTRISSLTLASSTKFSSSLYTNNLLFILDSSGLSLFDVYSIWSPILTQNLYLPELGKYNEIKGSDYFAVAFNQQGFGIIGLEGAYPYLIAEVEVEAGVQVVEVIGRRVIVGNPEGLKEYQVTDEELGVVEIKDELKAEQLNLTDLCFFGSYLHSELFLLDRDLGLIRVSVSPMRYIESFGLKGSKLSGYMETITIDGIIEVNIINKAVRTYDISGVCEFLAIDSQFIYCATRSRINYISREVHLVSHTEFVPIRQLKAYGSCIIVTFEDHVSIYETSLGELYIEGHTPDDINDYIVTFNASSAEGTAKVQFMLSVQYSVTNVVIFILMSFIAMFMFVFICSCVCKYLNKEKPEEKPIADTGRITNDVPPMTTERAIMSDRALIPSV